MLAFQKYRSISKILICFVLICFTGCVTTQVEYIDNGKFPRDKVYRIKDVYLKDGKVIHLTDLQPKFKVKYKNVENVIVYQDEDYNTRFIPVEDINMVKIEIVESNQILTAVIIVGVVATLLVIAYFIALGMVYTWH